MKYIQGTDRSQLEMFPTSLNDAIGLDNEVRSIDTFVSSLDMKAMGFTHSNPCEEGRPAYHPADLLKLYIYGYMNRTRSSRELEKETRRNIEVMWLMKRLTPDHNTISNFRRDNADSIRKVFESTLKIATNYNLIGGKLIAGDSVKLRAQNSKKNNYNADKIKQHLHYIDEKLVEYNQMLDKADGVGQKEKAQREIEKHSNRREKYEKLSRQLSESGQSQVSTSDPDSRQMIVRNNITEVVYNIQTTNDARNNLLLDYLVTQNNDVHALGVMVKRASEILRSTNFVALYDKGYHTGSEIAACHNMGVETLVAVPARPVSSQSPDPAYNFETFTYDKQTDTYTCPQNHTLTSNGNIYGKTATRFKQYKTRQCKHCSVRPLCTASKVNGRIIERSEYVENVERNKNMVEANPELYKRRQAIVEHPYGTIKRNWGYDHTIIKRGVNKVSADVGLIFTCYNLRRLMSILCKAGKGYFLLFLRHVKIAILSAFRESREKAHFFQFHFQLSYNSL
jgi:transposase